MSRYESFYIKPAPGEQVETVIRLKPEERPQLLGTVLDEAGKPLPDALISLFDAQEPGKEFLVDSACTDRYGTFLFGPLLPDRRYLVRVFSFDPTPRILEQEGAPRGAGQE